MVSFFFLLRKSRDKKHKSDYLSEKEYSEYFQDKFITVDYLNVFDEKNDIIIIEYDQGYIVNYYSARNISAKDAGYIQACIKQAGTVKENGQILPTLTKIHSETGFNKKAEITQVSLYTVSSQKEQAEKDEKDDLINEISGGSSVINGSDRLNVIEDFDIDKENSTDEWKNTCKDEMYNSYIETTNHFNGN